MSKKKGTKKRLVLTLVFIGLALFAMVLAMGGDGIRAFGQKAHEAGKVIHEKSGTVGEKADHLKEDIEKGSKTVKKTVEGMKDKF